jgi:hypothetical protein
VLLARQTDQALECFLFFLAFVFGRLIDSLLFAFLIALLALLFTSSRKFLASGCGLCVPCLFLAVLDDRRDQVFQSGTRYAEPFSAAVDPQPHKDLARNPYAKDIEQAKAEIEMGISAVHLAAGGGKVAPFFRFPALQHPPQLLSYLAERNIGVFSTDIDSRDFKLRKPEDVIKSVMNQLEKHGKGIILMHDFKHHTADALPELLRELKAGGYKVVHMMPKGEVTTVPKYDEMLAHEDKLSSNNTRPESSVIRTIGE